MADHHKSHTNEDFEVTIHVHALGKSAGMSHIFHRVSELEMNSSATSLRPYDALLPTLEMYRRDETRFDIGFIAHLVEGARTVGDARMSHTVSVDWDLVDVNTLINTDHISLKDLVPNIPANKLYLLAKANVDAWDRSRTDTIQQFGLEGLADILRENGYSVNNQEDDMSDTDVSNEQRDI